MLQANWTATPYFNDLRTSLKRTDIIYLSDIHALLATFDVGPAAVLFVVD